MEALVWTGPKKMEFTDVKQTPLQEGWVRLEVKRVGICGSELSGYQGHNSLRKPPLIMGHEFSGVVIETSDNVPSDIEIGKLVTVNPLLSCGQCRFCRNGDQQLCLERQLIGVHFPGAFAQYVNVPASQCHPIEDAIYGAMAEPLACSLRAVNRSNIKAGDIGMVIGAGIIGLMSIMFMRMLGAQKIIAVDTNQTRLELTKDWGATHFINPIEEDVLEKINSKFPGGVDCVVDAVGSSKTREQSIESLRVGGRVVFIGLHENPSTVPGNVIVRNEIEVVGTFSYNNQDFARAVQFVNDGLLKDTKRSWLDIRSLQEGEAAIEELISGKSIYSKILLVPNS